MREPTEAEVAPDLEAEARRTWDEEAADGIPAGTDLSPDELLDRVGDPDSSFR